MSIITPNLPSTGKAPATLPAPAAPGPSDFAAMLDGAAEIGIPAVDVMLDESVAPPLVRVAILTVAPASLPVTARSGKDDGTPDIGQHDDRISDGQIPDGLTSIGATPPATPNLSAILLAEIREPADGVHKTIDAEPPRPVSTHRMSRAPVEPAAGIAADPVTPVAHVHDPVADVPAPPPALATTHVPTPDAERLMPAAEIRQGAPVVPMPVPAPVPPASVQQLFAALARRDPVDSRWLDTVIRDVSVVASNTGDVRFRVEPDRLGGITIERTADRLEIGVSEARALPLVEAARPQILAGALAFGVPVSASLVVLDQQNSRNREDARPRHQIEHRHAEDDGENPADAGRYA